MNEYREWNLTQRLRWVTSLSLSDSPFVRLQASTAYFRGVDDVSGGAGIRTLGGGYKSRGEVQTAEVGWCGDRWGDCG
jgi:hypothetical protein